MFYQNVRSWISRKEVGKETPQYGRDAFAPLKVRISCQEGTRFIDEFIENMVFRT